MEVLRSWILGLTSVCLLTAAALALTARGPLSRMMRFVCGLVLTTVLFSPLLSPDMDEYALSLAEYRSSAAALTGDMERTREELNRLYIEAECAAYIVDEARSLGMDGRVEVRAKWRDNCWVPWEAELTLIGDDKQRGRLEALLEAELGIPAERQSWHGAG